MKATGIICMVLLSTAANPVNTNTQWQATNSKDGINAYIGKNIANGVIPTRVEMTVAVSPEKAVRVLSDIDNYQQWVPYCKKSYVIQRVSDTVNYSYQRISAPMVTDRDLVMRMTVHKVSSKNYELLLTAVPGFVKAESNTVRIEHFVARYRVYADANSVTHIEQECEVNIGGSIPVFLLKWANRNQPLETFESLRKQMAGL